MLPVVLLDAGPDFGGKLLGKLRTGKIPRDCVSADSAVARVYAAGAAGGRGRGGIPDLLKSGMFAAVFATQCCRSRFRVPLPSRRVPGGLSDTPNIRLMPSRASGVLCFRLGQGCCKAFLGHGLRAGESRPTPI